MLLVGIFYCGRLSDGLAVCDLRLANIALHLELALRRRRTKVSDHIRPQQIEVRIISAHLHSVDNDLQVQLSHALDGGLAGLLVTVVSEGRILLAQPIESETHLLLVGLADATETDLYMLWLPILEDPSTLDPPSSSARQRF